MFVVIAGNLTGGFRATGPFHDTEDAEYYIEQNDIGFASVTSLDSPVLEAPDETDYDGIFGSCVVFIGDMFSGLTVRGPYSRYSHAFADTDGLDSYIMRLDSP